jgi:nitrate/nitrite transporter NarK
MTSETDRAMSNVLQDIIGNVQEIVRSEVRLAKAEVKQETSKAGKAAGILAGGGVFGLYAGGFLLLAIAYALSLVVPPWLAALLTALLAGMIAGIMVVIGRKQLKQVDPKPEKTIESVKENIAWAKHQSR